MIPLQQRLLEYLAALTGARPELVAEKAPSLPVFLRERYALRGVHLFGRKFLLALEAPGQEPASPGNYAAHAAAIRTRLGEAPALVLHALSSPARNRMVKMGIPFIVPGNQMFLPTALMDLREYFPQTKPVQGKRLTPAAQCLVLHHLLRQPLEGVPLKEVARVIGYSPIMLTRVKNELEAAHLCVSARQGRAVILRFTAAGKALWDKAQPFLSSPVKKTHWVAWEGVVPQGALPAGISALSHRTLLNDDRLPTYALSSEAFQEEAGRKSLRICNDPDEASARVECWSYAPARFGENGIMDPLSLYLSLRDAPDERVQQQLEELLGQITW